MLQKKRKRWSRMYSSRRECEGKSPDQHTERVMLMLLPVSRRISWQKRMHTLSDVLTCWSDRSAAGGCQFSQIDQCWTICSDKDSSRCTRKECTDNQHISLASHQAHSEEKLLITTTVIIGGDQVLSWIGRIEWTIVKQAVSVSDAGALELVYLSGRQCHFAGLIIVVTFATAWSNEGWTARWQRNNVDGDKIQWNLG